MKNTPRSRSLSQADMDRPLNFWESGQLRQMLELTFELIIDQEILCRNLSVSTEVCTRIHDAVLPELFLFLTKQVSESSADDSITVLSTADRTAVKLEMIKCISREFDRLQPTLSLAAVEEPHCPVCIQSFLGVAGVRE